MKKFLVSLLLLFAACAQAQVPIYTRAASANGVSSAAFPLLAPDGSTSAPSWAFASSPTSGWYSRSANVWTWLSATTPSFELNGAFVVIKDTGTLTWSSSGITGAGDVALVRDAANIMALRNSTNPQAFRIYNTYTDASNNEIGAIFWSANQLLVGTGKNGTGTNRDVLITPGGTAYATFSVASANVQLAKPLLISTAATANQVRTAQTTAPVCSTNCGTSPSVAGTDTAMIVTLGTTPASAFLVTFNGTWAAAPSCVGAANTAGTTKAVTSITTTTTTLTVATAAAPATGDKYNFICLGVS